MPSGGSEWTCCAGENNGSALSEVSLTRRRTKNRQNLKRDATNREADKAPNNDGQEMKHSALWAIRRRGRAGSSGKWRITTARSHRKDHFICAPGKGNTANAI